MNSKKAPLVFTGKQLSALPAQEHEWIVDGLLRTNRRRPSALAGKPQSGKSTMAWQLAVDVANGGPFLGRSTKASEVLYIQSEETPEECAAILRDLGHDSVHDRAIHVMDVNSCGNDIEERLYALTDFLAAHPDVQLVIVETLDDFLQIQDIKENSKAREAFAKFDSLVMERFAKQSAFLMLHHLKKREVDQCGDALLGATVLNGRTDTKIYLKQVSDDDPRRIIHSTKRRGGAPIEKTYLDFDPRTNRSMLGMPLAEERKSSSAKTSDRITEQIIGHVTHHPSCTEDDCLAAVEGHGDHKRREFKKLLRENVIRKSGKGTKGSPFVYSVVEIESEAA
jgi:hypothetical protein